MDKVKGYDILIGKDSPKTEQIAANDLRDYLFKITGEMPSIRRDVANTKSLKKGMTFILGTPETNLLIAKLAKKGLIDISEGNLGKQGLLIKTLKLEGKNLIILSGYTSIGSMYAPYSFLENYCGVGFFTDGDKVEKNDRLDFGDINYTEKPYFEYRVFFTHPYWTAPYIHCSRLWSFEDWKKQIDWMRKKRYNILNPVHDEGTYLWGEVLFDAFPELKKTKGIMNKFVMPPKERTSLMKKVFQYARDNGVLISYNFMYSQVPSFYQEAHPELKYHKLNMDNIGICASQKKCKETMKKLWGKVINTYGIDESHLYFVCPYQHEQKLCDSFDSRAKPALQAYQVLKEIDPKAKIFFETWCWNWDGQAKKEWEEFNKILPKDAGIADWDSTLIIESSAIKDKFNWYEGRQWMMLDHLTLEAYYPPPFIKGEKPKEVTNLYRMAVDHEASGILAFNIVANTNELLCNLVAEFGWNPNLNGDSFLKRYVTLRFGRGSSAKILESYENYIASIDEDLRISAGDNYFPAELKLRNKFKTDSLSADWINLKCKEFYVKYECVQKAMEIALTEKENQKDNPLYDKYLWELSYIKFRWEGIISFYNAYKYLVDSIQSQKYFDDAMDRFCQIKELYRNKKEYSMNALQEVAEGTKYNPWFLRNWRKSVSDFWTPIIPHFNIVWENFDKYESALRSMSPTK